MCLILKESVRDVRKRGTQAYHSCWYVQALLQLRSFKVKVPIHAQCYFVTVNPVMRPAGIIFSGPRVLVHKAKVHNFLSRLTGKTFME